MNEHWTAAEADFQRFYGLDLREACYGASPLGSRRLMVLLRGLPRESSLSQERHPETGWGNSEELLATLAELVDESNRMFFAAMWRKRPHKPIQIRRPWQQVEAKPAKATHEEIMRFFGGGN